MRNLKTLLLVGGAGAVMALTALTGCKSSESQYSERSEGRAIDDKTITENIEKRLKNEPTYKFTSVGVQTFDGIVQLSGFVDSEAQKARAGQIAQSVDGVARVVNSITLKPGTLTPSGRSY